MSWNKHFQCKTAFGFAHDLLPDWGCSFIFHIFLFGLNLIFTCQHFQMDFPLSPFASHEGWKSFCCCRKKILSPQQCCCYRCCSSAPPPPSSPPRQHCSLNLTLESSSVENVLIQLFDQDINNDEYNIGQDIGRLFSLPQSARLCSILVRPESHTLVHPKQYEIYI